MKPRHCLAALLAVVAFLAPLAARAKPAEAMTKVKVYLSAEHAPEGLKAGSRANLLMVTSSTKTKGKAIYSTKPLAGRVEIVSIKREEKPVSPDKAVLVELEATKAQAAKIEKAKAALVTISEGGVLKMVPVPLRLEPIKPEK